ncbi:hypothetical protein BG015_006113 [Linnemannia schmuckeri]|uniref:SWI/SNF complex protein n=1 Tax=Linnemannia schmuckeri TaxID=64567 RepID=A0A9P5S2F2_9FUNG|nr:hypothetical protein BG015_006113 [Linnemannia schmuckeri]
MTARRKSGGADFKFYEAPSTIAQFERIKDDLSRDLHKSRPGSDVTITAKDLAQFVHALQQFQEDVLGSNSTQHLPTARPARIPAKIFRSETITTESPLYKALKAAYEYRLAQGWRRWDLGSMARKTPNIELVAHIRNHLVSEGVIKNPIVAFDSSVPEDERERLEASLERLGGTSTNDIQHATHVVHHSSEELESPEGEEWLRTLEKKDGKVLVHYWYYPDSYDEWLLETTSEFMDPEPVPEHSGAWSISTRWIRDSDKYNEWMNEEDYEPSSDQNSDQESAAGSPAPSTQRFGGKRDNSEKAESLPKRVKRSSSLTPLDIQPDHPGLQVVSLEDNAPRGRGSKKNEYEPIVGGELANIPVHPSDQMIAPLAAESSREIATGSDGNAEPMDLDAKNEETNTKAEADSSKDQDTNETASLEQDAAVPKSTDASTLAEEERLRLEEEASRYLSQQTQEVIIPSYSAWFSLSKIHEIEQKSLPEFFTLKNRNKSPSVYKEYRDFMVNTYRLNPAEYLTVTACRRNLAGDVCAIIRVHALLEQWGLINYQVDPDTRPSTVGPSFVGSFRVTADTPKGFQPFQPSTSSPATTKPTADFATPGATKVDINLALRRNIYTPGPTPVASESDETAEKRQQFNCFTCGNDCTKNRYHSIKTRNFELCSNCYLEGRFPSTMSSGDFIRFQSQSYKQSSDEPWTDQETLLLLEGLELYDEDWNLVAEHVGTRGREQCILHFLQLPIEDPYLGGKTERDLESFQHNRVPFSESENPVMSVVAFLASVVNPGVAAAAAQSALKELALATKSAKMEAEQAERSSVSQSKPTDDKGESSEAMDVDTDTDKATGVKDEDAMTGRDIAGIPRSTLEKAAAAALGSAAVKAKSLADYEEREIQRLVTVVVEMQLKKLELKLQQFEELENVLDMEKGELERQRQQLYLDRLAMKKSIMSMQEKMILARQTGNPQVFASVTVPPGGVGGTGMSFQSDSSSTALPASTTTSTSTPQHGEGVGPLSRDKDTEGVVMLPLP